jgi:hypothetical protein
MHHVENHRKDRWWKRWQTYAGLIAAAIVDSLITYGVGLLLDPQTCVPKKVFSEQNLAPKSQSQVPQQTQKQLS